MAILARGPRTDPAWLSAARQICRASGVTIAGWGPNLLTVESSTAEKSTRITALLAALGLHPVSNPDDEHAGLLDFSPNPAALHSQIAAQLAAVDISRRPFQERAVPLIWSLGGLLLAYGLAHLHEGSDAWVNIFLGFLSLAIFVWDAARVWGWRLEISPQYLRVRRYFRWTEFPWDRILSAHVTEESRDQRGTAVVALNLSGRSAEEIGSFDDVFALNLRDRLRQEIELRRVPAEAPSPEPASLVGVH